MTPRPWFPLARMLRAVWWAMVLSAGASGAACRRSTPAAPPARPRLDVVAFRDVGRDMARAGTGRERIDVAALSAAVRGALLDSGLVEGGLVSDAGSGGAVVRVLGEAAAEATEVGGKGIVRTGVELRISTRPSDAPGALGDELSASGEQKYDVGPGTDRGALAQKLVERTTVDLLAGFVARARLTTASPVEVHAAIVRDGGTVREEAVRIAGVRGLREEVPTLLALLQDDNEALRDAALGALIALKERRAVTELTRNRSLRDRHEMRKILEAIAILGGDEARDYLSFVAESHDDEEIRKLAAEAKARLDRRHGKPPSPALP